MLEKSRKSYHKPKYLRVFHMVPFSRLLVTDSQAFQQSLKTRVCFVCLMASSKSTYQTMPADLPEPQLQDQNLLI